MMKAVSIARKTLLEYLREPLLLGLALAFPIMFIGVYYIAFGETDQGLASYLTVLVINEDAGATVGNEHWQAGAQLIDAMRDTEWEGQPVFDVSEVADRHAAEISLWERKVSLLLTIPPDFTQALLKASAGGDSASPAIVSLVGDPNSDNFVFATSFLDDLVRQFVRYTVGWQSSLTVAYEFLPGTGTMSDFDFGVPGLIVFGTMFVVMFTASTLVRENVGGTLRRLRLTHTRARDLLIGVTLAQMVVALVQVPLTFAAAMAFGFRGHGSLPLAMGIGLLLTLSAVGLGLIVACFARNDGEAANLAGVVLVVMTLVSGAMYPMPDAPIATVAGRTIQIYDILPPAHAGEAMRRVLVLGDGPGAIAYELAAMTILAMVFLAAGVSLYQRLQLRKV
jgi:ABC-2 type transport system permease protein